MKIVDFGNGKFGLRRFWFFGWYYVDLKDHKFSWPSGSPLFKSECIGTLEQVRGVRDYLKPKVYKE